MTIKELKVELDKWDDDAIVQLYEDSETQGIAITAPGEIYPEHVIELP